MSLSRLFNSTNNYFRQEASVLQANRSKVKYYFEEIKAYEPHQTQIYLKAYDYFVAFPEDFDGATMTEDLNDIPGLELAAMLHDYLYVNFNASGNIRNRLLADKLFRSEMKRMGKSTWNTGARFVLLLFIFLPHMVYSHMFQDRIMTEKQKEKVSSYYHILIGQPIERPWHKEFRGEITVSLIIILSIIAIIY